MFVFMGCLCVPQTQAAEAPSISDIWIVGKSQNAANLVMAASLQGLVSREKPAIWFHWGGMTGKLIDELQAEGTELHYGGYSNVWVLAEEFREYFDGIVVYNLGQDSINVATTVAGQLDALMVDASLLATATSKGYPVLADVRGKTEAEVLNTYGNNSAQGIAVEQTEGFNEFLRDFAIMKNAFTYYDDQSSFRTQVAQKFGPQAMIYGWGTDEYKWVDGISQGGACGIPADWAINFSAMAAAKVRVPQRNKRYPVPAQAGERIVCFVMTDGDNIQWMANGFVTDTGHWASEHRGDFNMTWEMAPVLADMAPRALRYFYNNASRGENMDDFVCGPSGMGYTFPSKRPDRRAYAEQTGAAMDRANLKVISLLDSGGDMTETAEILEQPNVMGIFYKDYVPYNKFAGQTFWHQGKPCMSYRYLLWEAEGKPEWSINGVSNAISALPADPVNNINSYALVNVHAWSWESIGGPMDAVKQTIDRLPAGTRVVTGDEFVILLRNNFGTPVPENASVDTWTLY